MSEVGVGDMVSDHGQEPHASWLAGFLFYDVQREDFKDCCRTHRFDGAAQNLICFFLALEGIVRAEITHCLHNID